MGGGFRLKAQHWVLLCLFLAQVHVQWALLSLPFLASVTSNLCAAECHGETPPVCDSQPGTSPDCDACYADASRYDLKQGTCLLEGEYAILTSYGHTLCFALFGLWAGRLADQPVGGSNRINTVLAATVGVSVAMVLQAVASDGYWLMGSRVLLGMASAFVQPAALSMLADCFPAAESSLIFLSTGGSVYLGGALASAGVAGAHAVGWRAVSLSIAAFGLAVALSTGLLISDPERRIETTASASSSSALPVSRRGRQRLLLKDPVFLLVLVGSSLRLFGAFALQAYLPQFFKLRFPQHNVAYGLGNALGYLVCGLASSFVLGSLVSQWIASRGLLTGARAALVVPVGATVLGLAALLALLQEKENEEVEAEVWWPLAKLCAAYFLTECWLGPTLDLVRTRMTQENQSTGVATFWVISLLVGSLGPLLVGHFVHQAEPGRELSELRDTLSAVCVIALFGCAVFLGLAALVSGGGKSEHPPSQEWTRVEGEATPLPIPTPTLSPMRQPLLQQTPQRSLASSSFDDSGQGGSEEEEEEMAFGYEDGGEEDEEEEDELVVI